MIKFKDYIDEGKRGLWDNIHAKQKRIKAGSGERMRKPGSKGAPTAAALKASQNEEVELEEALDPSEIASNPRMYNADAAKKAYYHKNASASDKESLAKHLDRHHGNKEWRKPVKEEQEQIDELSRDTLLSYSNKVSLDSQKHSKDPSKRSGEKASRSVTGYARANNRLEKPVKEELSADELFDLIEEMAVELAEETQLDLEQVWEELDEFSDNELLEACTCWTGYKRKRGTAPCEEGSCVKEESELDEAAVDAKGYKSSTGGLTQKGRDAYNRKEGSNLKAPVTTSPSKLKKGSKAANRRKSFCARMSGVEGPMKKPNGEPTRKALALRKWNC